MSRDQKARSASRDATVNCVDYGTGTIAQLDLWISNYKGVTAPGKARLCHGTARNARRHRRASRARIPVR